MPDASPDSALSHWNKLIEGLQASPLDFYKSVEEAVKRRTIPGAGSTRVEYHEGGVLSAKREYLRVKRGRYHFDICGAPFGNGFFFSSWLAEARSPWGPLALLVLILAGAAALFGAVVKFGMFTGTLLVVVGVPVVFWLLTKLFAEAEEGWDDALVAMPFLGPIYERLFRPQTYYKIDTALMFQSAVHSAVMEVVDGMTTAKGIRALSEGERKPVMRDFFGKR